ncbi:Hypothetical predicted protein [Lecanosticta acicola]|uniref:Uncharacterized protein n=1 Tax=Lecanosticta acicola TaxID=111012 RepID=A0AAI8YRJ2_9PEZI|nr:Hypothetical predicted protein [Lecanosticta acicola]
MAAGGREAGGSSKKREPKAFKPKLSFFDLPDEIRSLVCEQAGALTQELDKILGSERVRATGVFRTGAEIESLSSVCCLVGEILSGRRPCGVPTALELQDHTASLDVNDESCPCCSAGKLLDLDGEVLRSFPDGGEDLHVDDGIQRFALKAVVDEAEKVLAALDALILSGEGGGSPSPVVLRRSSSLQSMARQVSSGLKRLAKMSKGMKWRKRRSKHPWTKL